MTVIGPSDLSGRSLGMPGCVGDALGGIVSKLFGLEETDPEFEGYLNPVFTRTGFSGEDGAIMTLPVQHAGLIVDLIKKRRDAERLKEVLETLKISRMFVNGQAPDISTVESEHIKEQLQGIVSDFRKLVLEELKRWNAVKQAYDNSNDDIEKAVYVLKLTELEELKAMDDDEFAKVVMERIAEDTPFRSEKVDDLRKSCSQTMGIAVQTLEGQCIEDIDLSALQDSAQRAETALIEARDADAGALPDNEEELFGLLDPIEVPLDQLRELAVASLSKDGAAEDQQPPEPAE